MANTLKFGNGNWATKEDSVLAYNDENNNFKPLPFDFTRASTATYVDSDGLIKTARNGEARIDYTDSTDGALLLEPARTNNYTYSEDFTKSTWTKLNVNVSSNAVISPDGTLNASKITSNATAAQGVIIYDNAIPTATGSEFTITCYFKASEVEWVQVFFGSGSTAGNPYVNFNIVNGTLGTVSSGLAVKTEAYSNGFYKITITATALGTVVSPYFAAAKTGTDTRSMGTNNWNAGDGFFMWGAQLEIGSYATSYIPTSGSAVTRVADAASQTPTTGIIGQTEGTFFYDLIASSYNADGVIYSLLFTASDATSNFQLYTQNSLLRYNITADGDSFDASTVVTLTNGNRYKIALAYKSGDCAVYVNGILKSTSTKSVMPTASALYLNQFSNGAYRALNSCNQVQLYNTRLTNAELATLTTI